MFAGRYIHALYRMMKKVLVMLLLSGFVHYGHAQCKLLTLIPDTLEINGINVVYYQSDSIVRIKYYNADFTRDFPIELCPGCNEGYVPSVWTPTWSNDRFIEFRGGCGTYCFDNILAPLNADEPFKYAGQIVIDTFNTIYFTLYHDTLDFKPYLKVRNYNTGKAQEFDLNPNDFWGAILLERLDYSESHPYGFTYEDRVLTLYLRDKDQKVLQRKFEIEI